MWRMWRSGGGGWGRARRRGGGPVTRREVIVCVDDEEGVLRVLRAQLGARFGHECQIATARSGDEAVALFDELTREGEGDRAR